MEFLGWRSVPVEASILGSKVSGKDALHRTGLCEAARRDCAGIDFDRKLYVARRGL